MTAVVGILNKKGAAIAADSAVTISRGINNRKIFNSANKMIRLLDDQPIAVMIVNNACLMGIPWDIIVRMYRVKRKGVTFPTMHSAIEDFISFIEKSNCFVTDDQNRNYISGYLDMYFRRIDASYDFSFEEDNGSEGVDQNEKTINSILSNIKEYNTTLSKCKKYPRLEDYKLSDFKKWSKDFLSSYLESSTYLDEEVVKEVNTSFIKGFYNYITRVDTGEETQLIFTGFGDNEQYPSLERVNVNFGIGDRLAYWENSEDIIRISDELEYAVCPFAQTDVMALMTDGIDPDFKEYICRSAREELNDMLSFTAFQYRINDFPEKYAECLENLNIDSLAEDFEKYVGKTIQEGRHTQVYDSVVEMNLYDMSHLAECLVSVTALSRHINFEQEGVGGLVDLAILTKADGFKWLNRKSWYDAPGKDGFKI